jgi:hypothetical protein
VQSTDIRGERCSYRGGADMQRCRYSGAGAGVLNGRCRGLHAENQMQGCRCRGGKLERER